MELNSEKIWKLWKKSKLNSEKIWKIQTKMQLNSEKIRKIQKKSHLNSEKKGKKYGKIKCFITSCTRKASNAALQTLRFEKVRKNITGK
jgi:hypothetical protein